MSDDTNTNEEVVQNETGYAAKNADLVKRLTKANKDNADLQKRLDKLEDAAQDAEGKSTELTKAQRALEKAEKEVLRLSDALTASGKQLRSVTIQTQIDKAMDAAGVLTHMREPLSALYLSQVEWDAEDASGTILGKGISDHINSHLKSKSGSFYVAAAETGGAGAEGNKGTTSATAESLFPDLSKVNLGEWGDYQRSNPEAANAYAKSKGADWLSN